MARYKSGTKEETRQRIVDEASRQFREKGIEATSIAEVMGALGLTVGGFYKHFDSKSQLLEESLVHALEQSARRLSHATPEPGDETRRETVARMYLTPEHRDNKASGCAIAALMTDIARSDNHTRQVFQEQLLAYKETIANGEFDEDSSERWGTLAMLVGGLMLSRSVADETLSNEILDACRSAFTQA